MDSIDHDTEKKKSPKMSVIPADHSADSDGDSTEPQLRVAAYCRVSTAKSEQMHSFDSQKEYYEEYIKSHANWTYVGIYADAGISGTSLKNRDAFNQMVRDCKDKKIDLILTKSISRFSRNTVDCLKTVRLLKASNAYVYFEKENINTNSENGEFMITLFSSLAQAESESLSNNVKWGIRKAMSQGKVPSRVFTKMLGYTIDTDGFPAIVPEEAEIIHGIYKDYINGYSLRMISKRLNSEGIITPSKCGSWTSTAVQRLLTNEKYTGDVLLQKTYTVSFLTKEIRKNTGQLPMYYIENHHDPIIPKPVFQWVQDEMKRRSQLSMNADTSSALRKYSGLYSLSNCLVCGECANRYKRVTHYLKQTHAKTVVWKCQTRLFKSDKKCTNSDIISEDDLHRTITMAINLFINDRMTSMITMNKINKDDHPSYKDLDRDALSQLLMDLRTQQGKLLNELLDNMDDELLPEKIKTVTENISEISQWISSNSNTIGTSYSASIDDNNRAREAETWIEQHRSGIQSFDDIAVRRLIDRITVQTGILFLEYYDGTQDNICLALNKKRSSGLINTGAKRYTLYHYCRTGLLRRRKAIIAMEKAKYIDEGTELLKEELKYIDETLEKLKDRKQYWERLQIKYCDE